MRDFPVEPHWGVAIGFGCIISAFARVLLDSHSVRKFGFDRWNFGHLKPWLLNAGFSEQMIEDKFAPVGQGFVTMSPALRELESVVLERKLRHGGHPILNMCCNNAVVEFDPCGINRKLSKKRATGRIDGMIALLNCFAVAPLRSAVKFDPACLIG